MDSKCSLARLLDIGLDRIRNLIMDMATLSEESVNAALESYEKGVMLRPQIFEYSEKLRILRLEVADFATELIARYQPVARNLRFIQSCMDVAYGFSRFGRYAYDISDVTGSDRAYSRLRQVLCHRNGKYGLKI